MRRDYASLTLLAGLVALAAAPGFVLHAGRAWEAGNRAGLGAALGAIVVNYAKTTFTSGVLAPYWLFMLGAMFILVTLLLPKGIVGLLRRRAPAA